ncbi:FAD-binding oxidoreductase [Histidinibacterium lentulum]|uniref:FAD-binding oxidoreductase n=1 Tax=Histidinibacterium lentulum TaxID=2480588 RepID=A0A3N2R1R6_9RHOB|nr:FAD-binding oxidoreductase [Histidinibacterium lentulum]
MAIIGGGIIGASVAWWLARDPAFTGTVTVIERDPSYEFASTTHTNSCLRQQFGTEINVLISRFAAAFIRGFREWMEDDEAPDIPFHTFGYLYLAATAPAAEALRAAHALQTRLGAGTRLLSSAEIAAEYPFYATDDLLLGSHGTRDEGYFDGATVFDWFRRKSKNLGVRWLSDEVTAIETAAGRVTALTLASGARLSPGWIVNASGPRAARTAAMAGLALPVEPRKRYTYCFDAADLGQPLPLTIDPSGIHVRQDGAGYMAGCAPWTDGPVDPGDFAEDPSLWEDKVWPALAARVPAFERLRLRRSWVGHYAWNTLDQNALLGPHPECPNLLAANGFSGHGLQQAPAVGRGIAELIVHGGYRSLDLSPLSIDRVAANRPLLERAVI